MQASSFKRLKKVIGVLVIGAMVVALAACGGNNDKASGDDVQKLRLGYLRVMDDAQTILAHKAGIYKDHGLDVTMTEFASGTDLIKAIVSENIDAGVLGFSNALSWIDRGSDLKIVGGAQMGFHSMLVKNDSGITQVAQLKGKKVASQKVGSTADIVLNGVVWKQAGLNRDDMAMQYVSPAVAIQSLATGAADGAFVFEPFASIAKLSYPVDEIYEIGQAWPFPCMVVITSGDLVKNSQDAVYKMLDAQKEAIEMLAKDPKKAATFIAPEFIAEDSIETADGKKVPAVDVIQASIESQTFNWAITEEDIARMDEVAQMMVDQGMMEKKIDVHQALDLRWQQQFD